MRCYRSCRSLVCLLDNLLHRTHLTVWPICNRHDRLILKG